jgi:hypothetical protein
VENIVKIVAGLAELSLLPEIHDEGLRALKDSTENISVPRVLKVCGTTVWSYRVTGAPTISRALRDRQTARPVA